jgi:hypothetical protein
MKEKTSKNKVLKMSNEEHMQELSALFGVFMVKLNNGVPKKALRELNDLIEDNRYDGPIMAIKKAIDEWLDGGRI